MSLAVSNPPTPSIVLREIVSPLQSLLGPCHLFELTSCVCPQPLLAICPNHASLPYGCWTSSTFVPWAFILAIASARKTSTLKAPYMADFIFCFAAAAKSLQSCPTLCDPIDGSAPGSPVPEILQARTLEWVAISFSNAWKWKVKEKSLSPVRLLAIP